MKDWIISSDQVFGKRFCSADAGAAAGDGGGGGGGGAAAAAGGDKDKDKGKTFTQEDVNAIVARESGKWQKKLEAEAAAREELAEGFNALKEEYGGFKQMLEEASAEVEEEISSNGKKKESLAPDLDEFERELQVPVGIKDPKAWSLFKRTQFIQNRQIQKLNQTLEELKAASESTKKMAEEERSARVLAEKARAEAVRDTELASALTAVDCVDIHAGIKLLGDQVNWDEKTKRFLYTMKDGKKMPVREGVAAEIPPWLQKASSQDGGSGSGGSRGAPSDREIQQLESDLQAAQANVSRSGGREDAVTQVITAKRRLKEAKEKKAQQAAGA